MVTKPFAFVVVAVLVVLAAGTGAYLAVRQNAPTEPKYDASMTEATSDASAALAYAAAVPGPEAVDATEQVVARTPESDDAAMDAAAAEPPPEPSPVAVPRPAPAAPSPPAPIEKRVEDRAPPATPILTEPQATDNAPLESRPVPTRPRAAPVPTRPRAADDDLPEVDGWKRVDAPRTAARGRREAEQVAVATVDPPWTGTTREPEPAPLIIEELVISADSVIGLQVDTFVTTEHAKVEDDVEARVTRDVVVSDEVAIPAGTLVMGSVVLVEHGGKIKGVSRLGVRFHTVVLDDGVEVPVVTETVYRESRSKGGQSAAKIGGAAVGGAILGAIFGGGRGAAIGGAAGAAGGTAATIAGDTDPATLPAGSRVTVRLSRPTSVTVER